MNHPIQSTSQRISLNGSSLSQDLGSHFPKAIFILLLLLFSLSVVGQCPGSGAPCEAVRWEGGGTWNPDGTINDLPNSPAPNGIIRCGSSAETQSQIGATGCYSPADFDIDISGFTCYEPSSSTVVTVVNPTPNQPIIWLNFDVRAYGSDFQIQINDNSGDEIGWALYYNVNPTNGTSLINGEQLSGDGSCDQSSYILAACGAESSNTWNRIPVPELTETTNYYLAIWDQDADGNLAVNNFKARFGCGDDGNLCDLELEEVTTECNPDGSTYTVTVDVNAVNGQFTASDGNATSISSDICFTNLADNNPVVSGTYTLTYPVGQMYSITIFEVTPSTIPGCANPLNTDVCILTGISGPPPICCIPSATCKTGLDVDIEGCAADVPGPITDWDLVFTYEACGAVVSMTSAVTSGDVVFCADGDGVDFIRTYTLLFDGVAQSPTCDQNVVVSATPLAFACPTAPVSLDACTEEADILTAYTAWAADFTATGGCNPNISIVVNPLPAFECGAPVSISGTVTVSDDCTPEMTCSSTFDVAAGTPLAYSCPTAPVSLLDCTTEADILAAYTAWAAEFTATGGCNASTSVSVDALPPFECGAPVSISGTVTVSDDCTPEMTCSSTFDVAAGTPLAFACPTAPVSLDACTTEDDILDAYTAWAADFSATGGCNPNISIVVDPLPDFTCGAAVSLSGTVTVSDDCTTEMTCSSTFEMVAGVPPTITCPANITIECGQSTLPADTGTATATDDCDADPAITYLDMPLSGSCPTVQVIHRVWTATDDCDNTHSCTQLITIVDTTSPVFETPPGPISVQCDIPAMTDLGWTDNCVGTGTVTGSDVSDGNTCPETITRTWTYTDACGNPASVSQIITVHDTEAPVFDSAPETASYQCPGDLPAPGMLAWTDNCDGTGEVLGTDESDGLSCPETITRTWTYTDACGNPATVTQTITVHDTVDPEFDIPPFALSTSSSEYQCIEDVPPAAEQMMSYTDNCDASGEVPGDDSSDGGSCPETITRTWTYVDACGNSAVHIETITVDDTIAPEIAPVSDVNITTCNTDWPATPSTTWSDNCSAGGTITGVTGGVQTGTDGCSQYQIYTFNATDDCGNTAIPSTVTVTRYYDETPPVITCPTDATVECNTSTDPSVTGIGTATDHCSSSVITTFSDATFSTACPTESTIERTWTAEDECGNTSTCVQLINIVDTTLPEITCPADYTVECLEDVPSCVSSEATATDNCSTPSISCSQSELVGGPCGGTVTNTYTATDACGNTAICTQIITVDDTEAPELVDIPADLTVQCVGDILPPGPVTATDNCSNDIDIDYDSRQFFDYVIGCDATDPANPVYGDIWSMILFNLPANLTENWVAIGDGMRFETYENGTARYFGTVAADNDPTLIFEIDIQLMDKKDWATWSNSLTTTSPFFPRTYKDTYNLASNDEWETWDYYVIDPQYSSLTGQGGLTGSSIDLSQSPASLLFGTQVGDAANNANTNYGLSSWFFYEGTLVVEGESYEVDSNGDVAADLSCAPNPFFTCAYDVVRTWTATDACGNTDEQSQVITVHDTTAPTVVTELDDFASQCGEVPDGEPVFDDNCDSELDITMTETETGEGCERIITRIWTATDDCDNTMISDQIITVGDTEDPVFETPPATSSYQCLDEVPNAGPLSYTDNCDDDGSVIGVDTSDGLTCPETITRTWMYTDDCGNSASVSQTITVNDTEAPVFDSAQEAASYQCPDDVPAPGMLAWTDNCDGTGEVLGMDTSDGASCPETITRTWSYTDACGNPASTSQTITVHDTEDPVFEIPPLVVGTSSSSEYQCADDVPAAQPLSYTDNCDPSGEVSGVDSSDGLSCPETITRTWTYVDACGNSAVHTEIITVDDTTDPVATGLDPVSIECDEALPTDEPSFTDNCDDDLTIVFSESSDGNTCPEVITRTWTATDDCNNSASTSQTITIDDTQSPTVVSSPADVSIECDGDLPTGEPVFSDNCDDDLDVTYDSSNPFAVTPECYASDPIGFFPLADIWTIVLFNIPGTLSENWLVHPDGLSFFPNDDGTADIIGKVVSDSNANHILNVNIRVENKRTWAEWSSLNVIGSTTDFRTYKFDGETPATADLHLDWDYYEIDPTSSTLTGEGGLAGTSLALSQAPSALQFGFQVGEAANNTNFNYGLSSWMYYDGELVVNGESLGNVEGTGDIAADLDCGPNFNSICAYEYTRTWTATDDCGNTVEVSQVVTVGDSQPPTVVSSPDDVVIECEDGLPTDEPVFADNCDDNLDITYDSSEPFSIEPECEATDPVGFFATAELWSVVLFDLPGTVSPYWLVHEDGLSFYPHDDGTADIMGKVVSSTNSNHILNVNIRIENKRSWAEWSSLYVNGSTTQFRTYKFDGETPATADLHLDWDYYEIDPANSYLTGEGALAGTNLALAQAPGALQFGFQVGEAANNTNFNYGFSSWMYYDGELVVNGVSQGNIDGTGDVAADLDCGPNFGSQCAYEYTRTWTATDDCGNSVEVTQVVTVGDNTAPTASDVPADVTVECLSDLPTDEPTFTDNCDESLTVVETDEFSADKCPQIVTRTWVATDDCDNSIAVSQTITVNDTTDPELVGVPADVTVECDADITPSGDVTAIDNCDADVDIVYDEIQLFELDDVCNATDPIGEFPTADTWSIILFDLPGGLSPNWLVHEDGLSFVAHPDGSANVVGKVVSDIDPTLILQVDIRVENRRDWDEWSALNVLGSTTQFRTYKDDPGNATAESLFEDWDYYEIDPAGSSLIGEGGLAGTSLSLSQAPGALQFGFQVGEAANNTNANFGLSSWMYFSGPLVVNGEPLGVVQGTGDIAADLECGPNFGMNNGYELVRTWTATDDCGNSVSATQVVTVVDITPPTMENPGDITITTTNPAGTTHSFSFGEGDNCDPIPTIWMSHDASYMYPVNQTTEVTAVCTDISGNNITCTFEVFVILDEEPFECAGDINGDQIVDIADFISLNSMFGSTCDNCPEDLNGDGVVDIADFLVFNSNFGSDCNTGAQFIGTLIGLNEQLSDELDRQEMGDIHPELLKAVEELRSTIDFAIVPNPNNGRVFSLFLKGDIDASRSADIRILDMTGREVYRVNSEQLNKSMAISTATELNAGVYLVSMTLDGKVIAKRMTVK